MEIHEKNGQFSTFGFFLYDAIHIATAIIILIVLFVTDAKEIIFDPVLKGEFAVECVNEFAEIALGALLMFFTVFIYKNIDVNLERLAYSFAFVIASVALLLPSISNIVDVIVYSSAGERDIALHIISIFQILFPLNAMVFFGLALFQIKKSFKMWARMLKIGMASMLLSSIFDLTEMIVLLSRGTEFEFTMVIETIALFAPILPIAFGLKDLKKMGLLFNIELKHNN